ncbi:carbohydrate kinase family protein [Novosphingobium sp.]|uniref:carbohydrate kinase family protein n=1 Tax=Novosphingobium sp. TaxID=1874826 RepID=UPI0038B9BF64
MAPPLDLIAFGLTTLDIAVHRVTALPDGEEGQLVDTIALSPAGTAGGTALVARQLGLASAIASAVGDDPQGQLVRALFDKAGVDTTLLATDPAHPTSTTVLPIKANGDRPNWHMIGASLFAPAGPDLIAALDRTAALHWGAVGFPGTAGQGAQVLQAAQARAVYTTCDLIAPGPDALRELEALLPHVDLFMPSLAEVAALLGTRDPVEGAQAFMVRGARGCLIKLGAQGALLVRPDAQIHMPALPITPVDTTSCGDSLCAGFHAARLRGLGDEAALRFAVATAAQVALGVGTLGLLESYEATLELAR